GNWIIANTDDQFRIETATSTAPETPVEQAVIIERTGTAIDRVEFPQVVRISDSGLTDWGDFYHDSTDFNSDFTLTADWNIAGLSSLVVDKDTSVNWLNDVSASIKMLAFEDFITSGDAYWNTGTELLLWFEGADEDTTYTSDDTNARTVTFIGTAKLDDAVTPKYNATTSLLLDGNSDGVSLAYDAGLFFNNSEDHTVEFFFQRSAAAVTDRIIMQANGVTGSVWPNFQIHLSTTDAVAANTWRNGGVLTDVTGTTVTTIDTWHHLAVVWVNADNELFL
ncbi:unnamed protein product, partial [marine sediment metagenome]